VLPYEDRVSKVGWAPLRPRSAESGTKATSSRTRSAERWDRAEVIVFVQLRAESGMVGGRKAFSGDGSLLRDKSGNVLLQPLDLRRSNGAPGIRRICF